MPAAFPTPPSAARLSHTWVHTCNLPARSPCSASLSLSQSQVAVAPARFSPLPPAEAVKHAGLLSLCQLASWTSGFGSQTVHSPGLGWVCDTGFTWSLWVDNLYPCQDSPVLRATSFPFLSNAVLMCSIGWNNGVLFRECLVQVISIGNAAWNSPVYLFSEAFCCVS